MIFCPQNLRAMLRMLVTMFSSVKALLHRSPPHRTKFMAGGESVVF
jgi:hypothetical protein